jgi:putative YhbY family RNA-binding protein
LQDTFRAHYITGMNLLPIAQRKALKARAHRLDPVVQVGGKGVTPALVAEIDRALAAHELIKVRAAAMDRHERDAALQSICRQCGASPVQHVGKVFVLYRPREEGEAPEFRYSRGSGNPGLDPRLRGVDET